MSVQEVAAKRSWKQLSDCVNALLGWRGMKLKTLLLKIRAQKQIVKIFKTMIWRTELLFVPVLHLVYTQIS